MTGWDTASISIHLGLLSTDALRFSAISRFFIINTLQLGGRILDALVIAIAMDLMDMKGFVKPTRKDGVKDFREVLQLINNLSIEATPYMFKQILAKACNRMISINFDVFQGKHLLDHPELLDAIIQKTYKLNILIFSNNDRNKCFYKSVYGPRVMIKIDTERPPKYLLYNKLSDAFGMLKADFVS